MNHTTPEKVWNQYETGITFKRGLGLFDTVKVNEDFFVGRQWEGVRSNGLPTPVFNFIKRIVLFLVASAATDNVKLNATPLSLPEGQGEGLCRLINSRFEALFEQNKLPQLIRSFMRNAAVDGDACIYSWFDPDAVGEDGTPGAIRAQLLENTRVIFGDPNCKAVQAQPYLIIARRERLEEVRREMKREGLDDDGVQCDTDEAGDRFDAMCDGKVTTLMKFWKDTDTGTVHAVKTVRGATVRRAWDTGQKLYPIVWMSWESVPNCYHGQAAVTGLIPNQVFVNKLFAMTMISLMTTAYPKVVYDRTRIPNWDNRVGAAIGVDLGAGSVSDVAKTIDPAAISPQVGQFIQLAVSMTKEVMGATDAALGEVRPDNTSAILALQKASQVPMELTRQDLYQCIEDLGLVWLDLMGAYYGLRMVDGAAVDHSALAGVSFAVKLDVGGSAYWSEIAQLNTLDNLLSGGHITVVDYLERVPKGYISGQQELIEMLKQREGADEKILRAKMPSE